MRLNRISVRLVTALLCLLMLAIAGCQRSVDVPSSSVLTVSAYIGEGTDYFPAGPEFKLENQTAALEEYKLEREKLRSGVDEAQ